MLLSSLPRITYTRPDSEGCQTCYIGWSVSKLVNSSFWKLAGLESVQTITGLRRSHGVPHSVQSTDRYLVQNTTTPVVDCPPAGYKSSGLYNEFSMALVFCAILVIKKMVIAVSFERTIKV